MVNTLTMPSVQTDLAGTIYPQPNFWQIQRRIRHLVQRYVTQDILRDRLEDLPQQFRSPTPRPWKAIDWQSIQPDQIIGIDLPVFLAILSGTIDTEAPIRGYTQASRQYLAFNYPHMARFVGGQLDDDHKLVELGLWEKEERQHTPTLAKLYTLLAGHKPMITPHNARAYRPSDDPRESLYRHGLHRVATEYSAACLYLWMMAYTTGPLQLVLEEVLIDEINHMTKFWGYGMWIFPDSSPLRIGKTLLRALAERQREQFTQGSLMHTLQRMFGVLRWRNWTMAQRLALFYAVDQVMRQLWHWNATLTPDYLNPLFDSFAAKSVTDVQVADL